MKKKYFPRHPQNIILVINKGNNDKCLALIGDHPTIYYYDVCARSRVCLKCARDRGNNYVFRYVRLQQQQQQKLTTIQNKRE